ncbi:MAG: PIN domain-containing protein [Acidobacteriota bacterium]|jgi:predicted nucleic acid-binding protein|nr:PIN domain-containing protein [Acidobacteriota bacterium]
MSVFVDTNVVVYAFDRADANKQRIAIELLEGSERLVLSTQVLLETWWVLTRRLTEPLEKGEASEVIDRLSELPVVSTDPQLVLQAIATSRRFEIAVWDALIIEAARAAGCNRVLSEDLQTGQDFGGVTIENPFV